MTMRAKLTRFATILTLLLALASLSGTALAQDGDEVTTDETADYCESRMALFLVDELGFDYETLAADGVGLGEIKKAWELSLILPGYEDNWQGLLAAKMSGLGWGNLKQAAKLAGGDQLLMDQFLELRQADVGWGDIKHAQALADSGLYTFEEALALLESGVDWDELKAELGIEGPPPWAGGPKKATKGQPPWAGGWKNKEDGS